tara:strand:+ start:843 stop:1973 length:1131 start_codon:yes stop_codon:yes gene_type:complete
MKHLNKTLRFLSSIELALTCFIALFILVLIGTFMQIEHGIYYVQKEYFHSLFITVPIFGFPIPVFLGGTLIGAILVINLTLSTILKINFNYKNFGLILIHFGFIVLLLGGGLSSCVVTESQVYMEENDTAFYSEDLYETELVIIDASFARYDYIMTVPIKTLAKKSSFVSESLPFEIKVHSFYDNAQLSLAKTANGSSEMGIGQSLTIKPLTIFTTDDKKNNPTAILSFHRADYHSKTMLLSLDINGTQKLTIDNKTYYLQIRPKRLYFPFELTLKSFSHDVYPGSDIPKNYSSLVTIKSYDNTPDRDVLIYMNHPLRHGYYTFYQASFGEDVPSSVLQVVYNKSWYFPYLSSLIIALGMGIHFFVYLVAFIKKRS